MFTILQKVVFKRGVRFKNLSVQHNVFTVNISFDVSLNDGVFVSNDPVNFVDPWGLESVTGYAGGSIHLGGGGVSLLGGLAIDTNGRVCVVSKICGTVGAGVYGDLGFEVEVASTDLCEEESESEGAFAKGGDGFVTGGSITGNSSGHSADAGFGGVGGGAAAGHISCKKVTICFN